MPFTFGITDPTSGRAKAYSTAQGSQARQRAVRVGRLVRQNKGALRLVATGVQPQQGYESAISGASPPQLRALVGNLMAAISFPGARPCPV